MHRRKPYLTISPVVLANNNIEKSCFKNRRIPLLPKMANADLDGTFARLNRGKKRKKKLRPRRTFAQHNKASLIIIIPVNVGLRHEPTEHVCDQRVPNLRPDPRRLVDRIGDEVPRVFVRGELVEVRLDVVAHRIQIAQVPLQKCKTKINFLGKFPTQCKLYDSKCRRHNTVREEV